MAEGVPCPSPQRLDQFLNGRLSAEDAEQLERHLVRCPHCLNAALAGNADGRVIEALRARAALSTGPESDAILAWLVEQIKPSQTDGAASALTGCRGLATVPGGIGPGPGNGVAAADVSAAMASVNEPGRMAAFAPTVPHDLAQLLPGSGPGELGRLGPYRLVRILGKGGMGIVFLAEDEQLQRQVAIKALLPAVLGNAEARQRFLREARAAAAIQSDHVIPIYQVGEERGIPYLVMPFLQGKSLNQWLDRNRKMSVPQVVRLARDIASGLSAAHEKGLIHRDIKPANLWLEAPSGRVKILDFGLARIMEDQAHLTQTGWVYGTPAFMAPEQAEGKPVDPRCDLFSLGAVLYLASTGELPFKGSSGMAMMYARIHGTARPVGEVNPELPKDLADLVMHLLAREPAQRPASAREVAQRLQALEQALSGQPLRTAPLALPVSNATVAVRIPTNDALTAQAIPFAQPLTQEPPSDTWSRFQVEKPELPSRRPVRSGRRWLWIGLGVGLVVLAVFGISKLLWRPANPAATPRSETAAEPKKVFLTSLKVVENNRLGIPGALPPHARHLTEIVPSFKGKPLPHGLFMHPPPADQGVASISYQLGGQYQTFDAEVTINDSAPQGPPLTFIVRGDGRILWETTLPVPSPDTVQHCRVSVKGVDILRLEVKCPDEPQGAHALWIDPQVSK